MITPDRLVLLAIIAIVLSAIFAFVYRDLIFGVKNNAAAGSGDRRPAAGDRSRRPARRLSSRVVRRSNATNVRSQHNKALNASIERSLPIQKLNADNATNADQESVMISKEEFTRLGMALVEYGRTGAKQRAIEHAFICKKGAGKAWKRASELFDLATHTISN